MSAVRVVRLLNACICVRAMTVAYQRSLLLQRFSQHVLNTLLEYCNAPQKAIFV